MHLTNIFRLVLILIVCNFLKAENIPLTFSPKLSTEYYSSGSILHPEASGFSILNSIELDAKKVSGNWSVIGNFKFISGNNADISSTYFNHALSIENQRGYYNIDNTWFESSNLSIKYQNSESFNLYFGKDKVHWGHGKASLILSKNTPSYPVIGFNWQISKSLKLSYLNGVLSSLIPDTLNTDYQNVESRRVYKPRGLAAHKLIWTISRELTFTAMESVIYGNRKIEEHYLLPFIPFWSMQHYLGDIDNVQMCGELNWKPKDNVNLYSSLFIDEWRPEWTFKNNNRNWVGYQFGIFVSNAWLPNDFIRIEYTWTDHRVYRHKYPINESYSFNYSLGFWAGPHAEESYFEYSFPLIGLDIFTTFSNVTRGKLTREMIVNQYKDIKDERYDGFKETRFVFSTKAIKSLFDKKIYFCLEGQYIKWNNAGFNPITPKITGNDISKLSINVEIIASTEVIFR